MSSKTIHYRYAQITKVNGTIQSLLNKALSSKELSIADNRREYFNSSSKEFRVMNAVKEDSSMLFGQLVFVYPDLPQTILNMKEGVKEYTINPFLLSNSDDEEKKNL